MMAMKHALVAALRKSVSGLKAVETVQDSVCLLFPIWIIFVASFIWNKNMETVSGLMHHKQCKPAAHKSESWQLCNNGLHLTFSSLLLSALELLLLLQGGVSLRICATQQVCTRERHCFNTK